MTHKEIIERNKLIAKFMGWKKFANSDSKFSQEMAIHEPAYNEEYSINIIKKVIL